MFVKHLFLACSLLISSLAQSQSKEVNLIFKHTFNGEELTLQKTFAPIWNGKKLKINRAEFYLSKFRLVDKSSVVVDFPETYMLINADKKNEKYNVGKIDKMDLETLIFSVGVDKDKNHADPTLYAMTHPLGLKEPSMHWGWAGGYRFMAIEGMVDIDGDNVAETEFQFHNLGDELYKQAKVAIETDESASTIDITIILDYAKLFEKLTMIGNNIVHGSSTKNNTMLTNAVSGGFFKQEITSSTTNPSFASFNAKQMGTNISVTFDESHLGGVISLLSSSGTNIYAKEITDNNMELDVANLPKAIYFISVEKSKNRLVKSIFIE